MRRTTTKRKKRPVTISVPEGVELVCAGLPVRIAEDEATGDDVPVVGSLGPAVKKKKKKKDPSQPGLFDAPRVAKLEPHEPPPDTRPAIECRAARDRMEYAHALAGRLSRLGYRAEAVAAGEGHA